MRFKATRQDTLPQVNLIPMLNAMLAILAFFVMVSVSLSLEKSVPLRLPSDRYPGATEVSPLVIDLDETGIAIEAQPFTTAEALATAQAYLQTNPQGFILLRPAGELTYQEMMEVLLPLQNLGGDRVSLVIRQEPTEDAP
ncbi:MAG: ExbD/TolR family protein [Prochlorotrichaceae cyanobacterium]|jgi:biopolymer transport protein ExbD